MTISRRRLPAKIAMQLDREYRPELTWLDYEVDVV